MRHHINGDRNGQDEDVILSIVDLDAVGVCKTEPFLGDFGNLIPSLLDGVFVVEDVALNIEVRSIVDIDRNVARTAAQLRAKYNVAPPDALQVAASLSFGAKAFLTNDKRLSRLQEFIDVLVLDDFIE